MRLSVVTVHLNDFTGLARTHRSIAAALEANDLQWIVVDGGSTAKDPADRDILEAAAKTAAAFSSEPDGGIYDAMNKGTRHSTGEYALFLNAGDELHPEFELARLESELSGARPEMIWGTCFERFPNGALIRLKNRSPRLAWYGIPVNHQNVLFRRDTLGDQPYDTSYRYCADYDLIARILASGGMTLRTGMPIGIFERGGSSAQNFGATMREEEELRCRHFGLAEGASAAITVLKKLNHKAGSVPMVRRLLRKWV